MGLVCTFPDSFQSEPHQGTQIYKVSLGSAQIYLTFSFPLSPPFIMGLRPPPLGLEGFGLLASEHVLLPAVIRPRKQYRGGDTWFLIAYPLPAKGFSSQES